MRQIKKTLSIFMAALFVTAGFLGNVATKAAEVVVPTISYVGVDHSPLIVGDTEKITVTSNYTGNVQYRAFLNNGTVTTELTNGYTAAVDAKTPYVLPETKPFAAGKYTLSVMVKKAGTTGSKSNVSSDYDTLYPVALNCVSKDDANRVYANGKEKVEINGLTVKFNGIENIGGIAGPYVYRLHIYNPTTDTWTKRVTEYTTTPSYTFAKAGTYMVVVHANTVNSTTWKNYTNEVKTIANQGSTYGTYEAWKTIMVTVKEAVPTTVKVFDTTVSAATFGSNVNVTLTADGVKNFATATQYQILDGTNPISAVSKLATATIVFPAKTAGTKVNVKLLDATSKEVKTIEVLLGQSGTIPYVAPVDPAKFLTAGTVKAATFGASVTVTSNVTGAVNYQILDGLTPISAVATVGTTTIVFPGKVAGNKVSVKLTDAAGAVVATPEVTLVAAQ